MTTPEQVPAELVAGDSWTWTRTVADTPATTHTAAWYFENKDGAFSVAASASGADFAASVAAATTATRKPGRYRWRLVVTKTSDSTRTSIESGWTELLPDPAVAGTVDWRSHARRVLDAIEAVIEGRANVDQQSMQLNGRALTRTPIPDLLSLRDKYKREVAAELAAERIAAGGASGRRIVTRMV
jgi:hypothetical protein